MVASCRLTILLVPDGWRKSLCWPNSARKRRKRPRKSLNSRRQRRLVYCRKDSLCDMEQCGFLTDQSPGSLMGYHGDDLVCCCGSWIGICNWLSFPFVSGILLRRLKWKSIKTLAISEISWKKRVSAKFLKAVTYVLIKVYIKVNT